MSHNEVLRYDVWGNREGETEVEVRADGAWVKYKDHADRIRELEAASGEPVAWAVRDSDGQYRRLFWIAAAAYTEQQTSGHTPVPLYAIPSAVVTITKATVEAVARVFCAKHAEVCGVSEAEAWERHYEEFKEEAGEALTAALTTRPTTPTRNISPEAASHD